MSVDPSEDAVEEPDDAIIEFSSTVPWVLDATEQSVAEMVGGEVTYLGNPVDVRAAELLHTPAGKVVRMTLRKKPRR